MINDRFKELRLALGLSQEQFGSPIGLTKSSVSNIEKHIRNLNERVVMLLESKFRANPTWLHSGQGEMFVDHGGEFDDIARQLNLNEFQRRMVQIIYDMPLEHQRLIRDYAAQLLAEDDAARAASEETEHERIGRIANDYLDAYDADHTSQKTDENA